MEEKVRVLNAADAKQVKEAGKSVKDQRKREIDDIRNVLSGFSGRRFFWRVLSECGLFRISHEIGGKPEDTIFREGKRNIGLFLLNDMNEADPDAYLKMVNESKGEFYA